MNRPISTRNGGRGNSRSKSMTYALVLGLAAAACGVVWGVWKFMPKEPAATPTVTPAETTSAKPAGGAPADTAKGVAPKKADPAPSTSSAAKPPAPNISPPINSTKAAGSLGEALTQGTPNSPTSTNPGTPANSATTPSTIPAPDTGKPTPVDVTRPDFKPGPVTPAGADGRPTPAAAPTPGPLTPTTSTQGVRSLVEAGDRALAANKLVEARTQYSKALLSTETAKGDQDLLRQKLTTINDELVFSAKVTPGDALTEMYSVASGDALEKIRKRRELTTEWMLIQRINKMPEADSLKIGQKLKLVRGPFHAVVYKGDFRLDVFAGSPDEMENWVYIRSFKVGLGEGNGTPVGTFVIKSKMQNPDWRNPRTGDKFERNDPKNPIGEYWLGWQGLGDSAPVTGYGLHGTIDPASVGQAKSMGCVRLLDDDIKLVYELLAIKISMVKVVP